MFCKYEEDYTGDEEIKRILKSRPSARGMYEAADIIRKKRGGECLWLPVDLSRTPDWGSLLGCLEIAAGQPVVLQVQGVFSSFFQDTDIKEFGRLLLKNEIKLSGTFNVMAEQLAVYIKEAVTRGVKIVSFADPSAGISLWGEKVYKSVIAPSQLNFLRAIEKTGEPLAVHICPIICAELEGHGYAASQDIKISEVRYIRALLEAAEAYGFLFGGNMCIHGTEKLNGKISRIFIK